MIFAKPFDDEDDIHPRTLGSHKKHGNKTHSRAQTERKYRKYIKQQLIDMLSVAVGDVAC